MSLYGKVNLEKYSTTLSLYLNYSQITLINKNDLICNGVVTTPNDYKKLVFDELIAGYSNPVNLLALRLHRRFMFA